MKMPGGGSGPGYNLQFAADVESRAIVGVAVTNAGSDVHESEPLRKQVEERTGEKVKEHLIDGGYVGLESIERAAEDGVTVYAPVPKPKKAGQDPHAARKGDGPGVAAWRQRMGTEAAKTIQITMQLKRRQTNRASTKFFQVSWRLIAAHTMAPKAPIAEASLGVAKPKNIDPMTANIRLIGNMRLVNNINFWLVGRRSSRGTPGARSFWMKLLMSI